MLCRCLSQKRRLTNGMERLWLSVCGGTTGFMKWTQLALGSSSRCCGTLLQHQLSQASVRTLFDVTTDVHWNSCNVAVSTERHSTSSKTASSAITGFCIDNRLSSVLIPMLLLLYRFVPSKSILRGKRVALSRPCGSNSMRTCSLVQ